MERYDLRCAVALQYSRNFDFGWSVIYGQQTQFPMYNSRIQDMFRVDFKYDKPVHAKCAERLLRFNDDYF